MRFALLLALAVPTAAHAADLPIARHVCPDGLEILVHENHALPLVTIEYAAKNGSMTEPPEYNGLSHLYEHMFFKANQKIPDQMAFLARTRELGMTFNGTTDTERVNYFFTTTSDHLADSMAFMRDAVVGPLFDPKEFERERVVVTGEIDRNEANPYYHFWHEVLQHVWWKYPSRKDPLGLRSTVLAATPEMMRTIQHRYYVPNNSVLVVTGNVNADEIFKMADTLYANWPKAEDPFIKYPLVEHPALPKSEVVVVQQPVGSFTGTFMWHGPSTVGPTAQSSYAADLLTAAISEPSSKFQKALVDSGACVAAGLSWFTQKNVGPISLSFEAAPDKIDACIKAITAELPKLKSPDYLSDDELKNAAHSIEVMQAHERESGSGYAHALTFWWSSAGLDYYANYVDNVKKASRADIAKYLDTFIYDKPFVFGALESPEMAEAADAAHLSQLLGLSAAATPAAAPAKPDPKPAKSSSKKKGAK